MASIHFYSERIGAHLHLGKRDAQPLKAGLVSYERDLRPELAKKRLLPKPPVPFGHGKDWEGEAWKMLGNGPDDSVFPGFGGCGDCAWAGPAHATMEAAHEGKRHIPHFTGKVIVEQYSEYTEKAFGTRYDPETGEGDEGSNPQEVFQWRQDSGLRDADGNYYKVGNVVAVKPGHLLMLWEVAYLFENCGIGFMVQEAQVEQFDEGKPWEWVPGSPEVGGHWVEVMGRPKVNFGALITWGVRHEFGLPFYEHQNDESYAYIDPLRYNAVTKETAEHYTEQDLEKFAVLVAQQKAANG